MQVRVIAVNPLGLRAQIVPRDVASLVPDPEIPVIEAPLAVQRLPRILREQPEVAEPTLLQRGTKRTELHERKLDEAPLADRARKGEVAGSGDLRILAYACLAGQPALARELARASPLAVVFAFARRERLWRTGSNPGSKLSATEPSSAQLKSALGG
jgi:hypothetical protein